MDICLKTFKSFSYKLNVEELRTNIVKKNLKNAISIYSSFRMETITSTFSLSFISIISYALVLFARFSLRLSLPPDSLGRPLTSARRPTSSVSFGRGRERGGKTSLHGAERETGRKIGIAILLARMKKCKRQLNILLICLCRVRTSVVHSPPGNPFCPREPLEREREERKESKREWRSNNFSTSSFPSFPKPGIERNRIAATFLSRLSFN